MKSSKLYLSAFLIISVITIAAVFMACGGSGGGSSSGSAAPASGSVAVMLTDGPYDDLDKLLITVTKVSLLRADNGQEVVVFEDPDGHEVDILSYQDTNYLLTVNHDVPVDTYNKVRLEVSKVEAVGGDCGAYGIEIKLPSGKIDLNPRGTFQVVEGESLAIRLDIDAKKSFQLHKAGNSGKCIFRPVIFVDIQPVSNVDSCPEVLRGLIDSVNITDATSGTFVLDLDMDRGELQVSIDDSTVIFAENGEPGDTKDIIPDKPAYVWGRIQPDGSLLASLVVIGEVSKVKGTATTAVNSGQYTMSSLDLSQELVVGLDDKSIILIDCNTQVDSNYIQQGVRTTVIGKYDKATPPVLHAIVVIVGPREITGSLIEIIERVPALGEPKGSDLTIQPETSSAETVTVFLPDDQDIYLQGDGVVDRDRLLYLLACPLSNIKVRVLLDTAIPTTPPTPPTTKKVYVIPAEKTFIVASVNTGMNTISADGGYTIYVESDATIIKKTGASYVPIDLSKIRSGDEVTVFGLDDNCKSYQFYGYIVLVED